MNQKDREKLELEIYMPIHRIERDLAAQTEPINQPFLIAKRSEIQLIVHKLDKMFEAEMDKICNLGSGSGTLLETAMGAGVASDEDNLDLAYKSLNIVIQALDLAQKSESVQTLQIALEGIKIAKTIIERSRPIKE